MTAQPHVVRGTTGTARPMPLPADAVHLAPVLQHWLIAADAYHPDFRQWVLAAVTLADLPGFVPARRHFGAATHEIAVIPVSASRGYHGSDEIIDLLNDGGPPLVMHRAIRAQLAATGDEIRRITPALAYEVVSGFNPEHPGAEKRWRKMTFRHLTSMRSMAAKHSGPQTQHMTMTEPETTRLT
jgi:hypothetical protein